MTIAPAEQQPQGSSHGLNASPWRLDVDWRWHRMAIGLGCMMNVNPDAHSTDEIDNIQWGVTMARKGGIPPTM